MTHGGKRAGSGRSYSPYYRAYLASRYVSLVVQYHRQNKRSPGKQALDALHAEEHPDGGGSVSTTRRLVQRGYQDDNFIAELDAARHNGEALSEFQEAFLRQHRRRWQQWARRRRQKQS